MRLFADPHPTDGTLRRLLDEPAGVTDADRAHVAGCATCLPRLAAVRDDAAAARAVLAPATALDLSPGSVGTTVRRAESALREELTRRAPVR